MGRTVRKIFTFGGVLAVGATLALFATATGALADPVVPGYIVNPTFSNPDGPQTVTFDNGTVMYVGNGAEPGRIYEIDLTSPAANSFGDTDIYDPDAVLCDPSGCIGPAGSVLVGGKSGSGEGQIWAIWPDETTHLIFESTDFLNPSDMAFDSTCRLVFVDCYADGVFATSGGDPTLLRSVNYPTNIAIDADDRIFVGSSDGTIRIYASDGTPIEDPLDTFSSINGCLPIAFGPGGTWGTGLYAIGEDSLWRFNADGSRTAIGTGFDSCYVDMGFGPDGSLYVSDYHGDRIIQISVPEPGILMLGGLGSLLLIWRRRRNR